MAKKTIIVTGISQCGKSEHCEQVKEFAKKRGHHFEVFSVGDAMKRRLEASKIPVNKHILNRKDSERRLAAGWAIKTISNKLKEGVNIINTHTYFKWEKVAKRSYNKHFIKKYLKPDLFITFIDAEIELKERLLKNPQWGTQKLTLGEIARWQGHEILKTQEWAEDFNKPHYVLPVKQPPETLYKLIMFPKAPVFYQASSMSHLKPELKENAMKFLKDIRDITKKYGTVIDPWNIDMGNTNDMAVRKNTAYRDRSYFVGYSDVIVGCIFSKNLTVGLVSELIEAHELGKHALLLFPDKQHGPFEDFHTTEEVMVSSKVGFKSYKNYLQRNFSKLSL